MTIGSGMQTALVNAQVSDALHNRARHMMPTIWCILALMVIRIRKQLLNLFQVLRHHLLRKNLPSAVMWLEPYRFERAHDNFVERENA